MKYNLSKIMLKAWKVYRKTKNISFAEALHRAWLSAKAEEINAKRIEDATGIETRATILGHMQRGGSPTCKDRVYASTMGAMAVDLLCQGKTNRVVGYQHGEFVDFDIEEALAMKKTISAYQYDVAKSLAI